MIVERMVRILIGALILILMGLLGFFVVTGRNPLPSPRVWFWHITSNVGTEEFVCGTQTVADSTVLWSGAGNFTLPYDTLQVRVPTVTTKKDINPATHIVALMCESYLTTSEGVNMRWGSMLLLIVTSLSLLPVSQMQASDYNEDDDDDEDDGPPNP